MATQQDNSSVYEVWIDQWRKAADEGLRVQTEALTNWSRLWGIEPGPQQLWFDPFREVRQQWVNSLTSLARNQWQLVERQFDTAIHSLDALGKRPPVSNKAVQTAPRPVSPAPAVAVAPLPRPTVPKEALQKGHAMNIAQKVAVVTGAASGIGAAVAEDLAKRGARAVLLVDLSDRVVEVAKAINKAEGREVAEAIVGDTSDSAFRASVFDNAAAKHGIVSICVPAAGITRDSLTVRVDKETGKASVYPVEDFRKVTEINLIAPVYWAMEMVARIAQERRRRGLKRWEPEEEMEGVIVFLGSVSSQGNKGQISYATAKAGLEGAAATLMKEAIFHGVRCAIIHPGFTDTPMARALGQDFLDKNVLPYTQLRRLIKPEEIADAVCFMISNSAVSGELWADAGWHPPA